MSLDIRRMLMLEQVADAGSLTAAANTLHLTVSAVSQQVARLEDEAGQPLIERGPRGVSLTEPGRVIVDHARSMRLLMDAAEEKLAALSGLRAGTLRLGTIPTVTESFLPDAISSFRSAHPAVSLTVQSTQISELRDLFLAREIEIAVMWEGDEDPLDSDGTLVTTLLREDPSVLLVPAGHPAAGRGRARLDEFGQERWIIRSSPRVLAVLEAACHAAGFAPLVSFEARGYQEVQAMVAIGMGVALVPALSLATLRDDVAVLALTPRPPHRRVVLVQRRRERLSPAAEEMARVLKEAADAYSPRPRHRDA